MGSNPRVFPRRWQLLLGAVALMVFGIFGVRPWYKEYFCPMFYYLPKGDSLHILPWAYEFITADEFGNFAIPDGDLNLLLVVVAPSPNSGKSFWEPAWGSLTRSADRNRAILQLDPAGSRGVEIRRTTDAMIVVLPDGTQLRAPLKASEAKQLFTKVQAIHLFGERSGRTIMSSIEDAVDPWDAEVRTILKEALKTSGWPAPAAAGMGSR